MSEAEIAKRCSCSIECSILEDAAGMPSGRLWSSGVEIGEYHGVVRVRRRHAFQRLLPERCVEV